MSTLRTIDTLALAQKHWSLSDKLQLQGEPVEVTSNTRLYRFEAITAHGAEPDVIHVLTDGAGGAEVIVAPQSDNEKRFTEHVADFLAH
jgi:hypothetical protein